MDVLYAIGAIWVAYYSFKIIYDTAYALKSHLVPLLWKQNFVKSYGKWAVITGCTDGIGKGYMKELAKRGMNVVLIARNSEKLKKCSTEIREKYGVNTEIVQVDFSNGRQIYKTIEDALRNKEIGILVNNVGVGYDQPKNFLDLSEDDMWNIMTVNVSSVPAMIKIVLPSMIQRKKGAIVNIASLAAYGPVPYISLYSATKAFVDYVSTGINEEYKRSGVTIQTVYTAETATKMIEFSTQDPSFLIPDGMTYAKAAVNTIGFASHTTGYWKFGFQEWGAKVLPRSVFVFLAKLKYRPYVNVGPISAKHEIGKFL